MKLDKVTPSKNVEKRGRPHKSADRRIFDPYTGEDDGDGYYEDQEAGGPVKSTAGVVKDKGISEWARHRRRLERMR